MRKLPFLLLAALAVPAAGALAVSGPDSPLGGLGNLPMQSPIQASVPAPDRIVKFYEMSFGDAASWSCTPTVASVPGAAQALPAVQATNCMSCTNQGSGSGDIVVDRPPDGAEETIPAPSGAEVQICGDVLALRGSVSSAGATASSGAVSSSSASFGGSGSGSFGPAATGSGSGNASGSGSSTGSTATASGTGSSGTQSGSAFGPAQ